MTTFQSSLSPFGTSNPPPINIECEGEIEQHRIMHVKFALRGDLNQLSVDDPVKTPQRTDELWKKTCFEIFIKGESGSNYWEYNLSPSRSWAAYGFADYRDARIDEPSVNRIDISTHVDANQLSLSCTIPLPPLLFDQNFRIGISTVVQDKNGNIYYYALKQTGEQPDFHADENFCIHINKP